MKLTKRAFLKLSGITAIGVVFGNVIIDKLVGVVSRQKPFPREFNPEAEYGRVFPYVDDNTKAIKAAKESAQESLPPNTYYEIREQRDIRDKYNEGKGVAWYYNQYIKKEIEILRMPVLKGNHWFYHGTFKTIGVRA